MDFRYYDKAAEDLFEGIVSIKNRYNGFKMLYCLCGHRDSLGCKQRYGAADDDRKDRYNGNVAQWLSTGGGMLHEEMWDIQLIFNVL